MANGLNTTGFFGGLAQGIGQVLLLRQQRKQREEAAKAQQALIKAQTQLAEIRAREAEQKELARGQIATRVAGVPESQVEAALTPSGFEAAREEAAETGVPVGVPKTGFERLVVERPDIFMAAGATPGQILTAQRSATAPQRTAALMQMLTGQQAPPAQEGAPGAVEAATAGPLPTTPGEALPARGAAPGGAPGVQPVPEAEFAQLPAPAQAQNVGTVGAGNQRVVLAGFTVSPTSGQVQLRVERNRPVGRPVQVRMPDGGFAMMQRWLDGPPTISDLPPNMQSVDIELEDGSVQRVWRDVAPRSALVGGVQAPPGPAAPGTGGLAPAGRGAGLGTPGQAMAARGVRIKPGVSAREAQKFLPAAELQNLRVIDRANQRLLAPPIQLQRSQLNEQDFVRVTPTQSTKLETLDAAISVLDELRSTARKVFITKAGVLERSIQGGLQAYETLLQSDPDLVLYRQQSQGFLGVLARAAASEKGPLNEGDVRRAGKIVPRLRNIAGLPDTAEVAERKMATLDRLLKSQYNTVIGRQVFDIAPLTEEEANTLGADAPEDVLSDVASTAGTLERSTIKQIEDRVEQWWRGAQKAFENLSNQF